MTAKYRMNLTIIRIKEKIRSLASWKILYKIRFNRGEAQKRYLELHQVEEVRTILVTHLIHQKGDGLSTLLRHQVHLITTRMLRIHMWRQNLGKPKAIWLRVLQEWRSLRKLILRALSSEKKRHTLRIHSMKGSFYKQRTIWWWKSPWQHHLIITQDKQP